jgi:hypothetical protein
MGVAVRVDTNDQAIFISGAHASSSICDAETAAPA